MKSIIAKLLFFLRYNLLGDRVNSYVRKNHTNQWFVLRNYLKRWQDLGHIETAPYQSIKDAIMADHLRTMLRINSFDTENQNNWAKNFLYLLK
jgi:hypothetical protein